MVVAEGFDGQAAVVVVVGWRGERRVELMGEGDWEVDFEDTGFFRVELEGVGAEERDGPPGRCGGRHDVVENLTNTRRVVMNLSTWL